LLQNAAARQRLYLDQNVQRQCWFLNQFLVGTSPLARAKKRSASKRLNNVVVIALERT
jgi:hypothetical protein